ncbi:MAG: hypothetical protein WD851_19500 [Pirellulales bacterium]
MNQWTLLALEAAQSCKDSLLELQGNLPSMHDPIVDRALAMCLEIERHSEEWAPTRLHRWLGFVFGVMAARNIITISEQSALMRSLLIPYPEHPDLELADHHNPRVPFQLDFGGSE